MWVNCCHQLSAEEGRVRFHYVNYKESQLVVDINEDVAATSLLTLRGKNNEDFDKQDMVTNIEFEAIVPSIKKHFFHQHMVDFVSKLELSDQKC